MAKKKFKRRVKGSGSLFVPEGRRTIELKFLGQRISTGVPDTDENIAHYESVLDRAFMEWKLNGRNIFLEPEAPEEKPVILLKTIYDEFIETRKKVRSAKTIEGYDCSYKFFFTTKGDNNKTVVDKNLPLAIEPIQAAMEDELEATTLARKSKENYIISQATFFKWCMKKKYVTDRPDFDYLRTEYFKNEPGAEPKIYTEREIKLILEYFDKVEPEIANIIRLLICTAFRIHEALELLWSDIRAEFMLLTSKDGKRIERFPIWSEVTEVLERIPRTSEKVFSYSRSDYRSLLRKLDKAFEEIGHDSKNDEDKVLKDDRAWHDFRRVFISRMARSGMTLDRASKLARCSVEVMMKHYRAFNIIELKDSLEVMAKTESGEITEKDLQQDLERLAA
ncbi:MAG TPA: tyrosine-type recombinase/integrase [Patescibacteria group bacterium]|nr:tyrosine-type recombinase/integrase [Patescibacteria group bacterium]